MGIIDKIKNNKTVKAAVLGATVLTAASCSNLDMQVNLPESNQQEGQTTELKAETTSETMTSADFETIFEEDGTVVQNFTNPESEFTYIKNKPDGTEETMKRNGDLRIKDKKTGDTHYVYNISQPQKGDVAEHWVYKDGKTRDKIVTNFEVSRTCVDEATMSAINDQENNITNARAATTSAQIKHTPHIKKDTDKEHNDKLIITATDAGRDYVVDCNITSFVFKDNLVDGTQIIYNGGDKTVAGKTANGVIITDNSQEPGEILNTITAEAEPERF